MRTICISYSNNQSSITKTTKTPFQSKIIDLPKPIQIKQSKTHKKQAHKNTLHSEKDEDLVLKTNNHNRLSIITQRGNKNNSAEKGKKKKTKDFCSD